MNNITNKIKLGGIIAAVMVSLTIAGIAQGPWVGTAPPAFPAAPVPGPPIQPMYGGVTMERSIAVDKNVNLSLCVTQGNLKINGWNRNEIRVYVQDGAKFGFKVLQKKQNSP